jgi:3-oxoacyl-[acyl-carrier protein] reductase
MASDAERQIVIVTGASRGIGRAVAVRFARDGAAVIVNYRGSEAAANETAQAVTEAGGQATLVQGDVSSRDDAERLIEAAVTEHGRIDVLVNNAGITRDQLLMRMKDEDWQAIIDTNLTSVYRTSKAVMRGMMKARKGRIVSITSVVGLTGNPGQTNYAAAKAGILGFTKSLAREVGSRGITVNAIAPGFIDTDMTRALAEAQRAALNAQIPLGRLGQPADIAAAVAFLCSPDGAYITGETLHVNGGMYMP